MRIYLLFFLINVKLVTSKHVTRCGGSLDGGGGGMPLILGKLIMYSKVSAEGKARKALLLYITESSSVCIISLTHLNSTSRKRALY